MNYHRWMALKGFFGEGGGGSGGSGMVVCNSAEPTMDTPISKIEGLKISFPNATSIGKYAFLECTSLVDISLPNVTSIGVYAFGDCTWLTKADLSKVTSIDGSAFYRCTSLTDISLPNVTSIGNYAFSDCTSLTDISLPNATSIGENVFFGCLLLDTLILGNTETVCDLNITAVIGTKIATEQGVPTGEGFIYVPEAFYEQYMANLTEQAYMLLVYSGYSEAEAEYMAPYIISAILRTIEGDAQASTFGLRNPLANFKGFTEEAIEMFKANYKRG